MKLGRSPGKHLLFHQFGRANDRLGFEPAPAVKPAGWWLELKTAEPDDGNPGPNRCQRHQWRIAIEIDHHDLGAALLEDLAEAAVKTNVPQWILPHRVFAEFQRMHFNPELPQLPLQSPAAGADDLGFKVPGPQQGQHAALGAIGRASRAYEEGLQVHAECPRTSRSLAPALSALLWISGMRTAR